VYASWSEVVAAEQTGVVRIRSTSCDGSRAAAGSGFVVGAGLVATAAHVVDGFGSFVVDRAADDPERQPATLIGINVAEDVALLRIGEFTGYQFSFEDVLPVAGADVGLIGYSGGRVPARPVRGTVNHPDLAMSPYGKAGQYHPTHLIEHDLPSNGGDSGAPLLDPVTGRVVGINVASDSELQGVKFGVYPAAAEALVAESAASTPIDQCVPTPPPVAPTTVPVTAAPTTGPTTSGPTTTTAVAGDLRYRVVTGDTLFGIARAFNTTFAAIQALNDPALIAIIREGDIIVLPAGARPLTPSDVATSSYTVLPGDTIIGIARAASTTPAELLAINGKLQTPDVLKAGQVLLIPRRG
jgi:LysM repeat protein